MKTPSKKNVNTRSPYSFFLFPDRRSGEAAAVEGLTWAFWTIVGNLDEKALNKLSSLESGTRRRKTEVKETEAEIIG